MKSGLRVANPPARPLLVYDGECHFCTLWIRRGQQLTGDAVEYWPAQDPRVAEQFPEIAPEQFASAVQYIDLEGMVYSGAAAVCRTLAQHPRWRWPLAVYEDYPLLARLAERAYRFVAEHRPVFSALTRWGWGRHVEAPSYFLVRWLFLRALGVIWLVAFLSLGSQVNGLIGHNGILPADQFMAAIQQQCDTQGIGWERYHLAPTLCWWDCSNAFLDGQCVAGLALAGLVVLGIAPAPCLFLLWVVYLSLVTVGRDFYGFQWDNLLLETGWLAIFLAPLQLLPRPPQVAWETPPPRLFVWLLRLLLFKLMFSSGCVKLLSHDPTWWKLTALTYHYQTQPLPPWTAWYAQQLPVWFQKLSCATMFGIELGAPWLMFGPRRIRLAGAALLAGLQGLILLTGNYTYFNWLTLALCLGLLDDFALGALVPARWRGWFGVQPEGGLLPIPGELPTPSGHRNASPSPLPAPSGRGGILRRLVTIPSGFHGWARTGEGGGCVSRILQWPRPALVVVAVVMLGSSGFVLAETLGFRSALLAPFGWMAAELEPFRTVNSYGLFAVMTTQRNEIVVEGSNDGVTWRPYEFKYKPGDVHRRPAFVAPMQPRLDWQMWFAALGNPDQSPWLEAFCGRLLQGSPEVVALLAGDPFPDAPPKYIRAEFYRYQFTDFAGRRATGAWWQRTRVGEYLPAISLRE